MAGLTSFCGLLTLQVGASILAALFFALAAIVLAANVFDYTDPWGWNWPINLVLMLFLVILLIAIGICAFAASYTETRRFALVTLVLLVILLLYWLILCGFSFFSSLSQSRAVCIATRCPESLWIANLVHRRRKNYTDEDYYDSEDATVRRNRGKRQDAGDYLKIDLDETALLDPEHLVRINNTSPEESNINGQVDNAGQGEEDELIRPKRFTPIDVKGYQRFSNLSDNKFYPYNYLEVKVQTSPHTVMKVDLISYSLGFNNSWNQSTWKKSFYIWRADGRVPMLFTFRGLTIEEIEKEEERKYGSEKYGWGFIGAIILFAANLLFFIFSALVMWSFASKPAWDDEYVEEEQEITIDEEGY